eukprot:g24787.t1
MSIELLKASVTEIHLNSWLRAAPSVCRLYPPVLCAAVLHHGCGAALRRLRGGATPGDRRARRILENTAATTLHHSCALERYKSEHRKQIVAKVMAAIVRATRLLGDAPKWNQLKEAVEQSWELMCVCGLFVHQDLPDFQAKVGVPGLIIKLSCSEEVRLSRIQQRGQRGHEVRSAEERTRSHGSLVSGGSQRLKDFESSGLCHELSTDQPFKKVVEELKEHVQQALDRMPGKMSRMKIEAAMKGKRMPFDDQVLDYLLNVASSSASKELVELMEDFCPNWQKHERIALAALLAREAGRGDGPDHSSRSAPSVPAPDASDADMLAQDMALAQMLQEEEDAKYTNNPGQSGQMSSKKGKRAFKPLNINYTVARGGNAPPALGTAAPSSLADVLRQKRSQQVLDTGPPNLPALNAPSERPTPWTPSGLTWAEKLQLSQEPVQEEGESTSLREVRVRANRAEHVVEATSEETVGDVKKRLEKMHGFAFNLQRLLHLGRELQDDEALQSLSATNGQIVMQLPRLRLQMPGGSQPMATEVPEKVTGDGLKEQIQREHAQQGVANGGCISVSLAPPPERPEQRFPAPEPPEPLAESARDTDERTQLIQKVFAALNRSHTGHLNADEMRPFANQTGFEGSDAEWRGEFDSLRHECGSGPGISLHHFQRLADGLTKGPNLEPKRAAPQPEPRNRGPPAAPAAADGRTRLIEEVFTALNRSRTGNLNADEMRPFANQTGFQGSDAEWQTEFDLLRKECGSGSGISLHHFRHLDYGAPNGDQGIVDRQAAAKAAKAINDERTQLIQEIFTALNRSRSGHLNADEMRPFGDQTGFEGTDAEWRQEFDLLRKECGSGPGISLDDGCYCSDEELRRLLQSLQGGSTSASMPPEPRNWAPAAKGNADERVQLIEQVFNTLNRSCTGYLNASEMRPFANRTGFDGTDAEWRQEFELLQKECGSDTGISLHHFHRLANETWKERVGGQQTMEP